MADRGTISPGKVWQKKSMLKLASKKQQKFYDEEQLHGWDGKLEKGNIDFGEHI